MMNLLGSVDVVHSLAEHVSTVGMVFAAESDASTADFFASDMGKVIKTLLGAVAFLVVIAGGFASMKNFLKGEIGKGVKILLGALIVAVFLFQPSLVESAIKGVGDFIEAIFNSSDDLTNTGGK